MTLRPFLRPDKEYESTVGEYRIFNGLGINKLAELSGISSSAIVGLQSGMIAPCYTRGKSEGQIKPWVKRVCEVLRMDEEGLFPRYFCEANRNGANKFTEDQAPGFSVGEYAGQTPQDYAEQASLSRQAEKVLATLTPQEEKILRLRFWDNYTLDQIAKVFGVSRERIRQKEAKALRKLRHPTRARKLKDFIDL